MEKYKTEFKLKVVKSFLAGEGGAKLLARHWSVPEEKIRTWVSHYRLHGIDGLTGSKALPLFSLAQEASSSPQADVRLHLREATTTAMSAVRLFRQKV